MGRVFVFIAASFLVASDSVARADERVDYLKEIKPLLREKCFACHGGLDQKAKLRLDTAKLMIKGGKRGPAIQPGSPERSLLIERITAKYETERMPPEGPPLSAVQIAKLKAWIAQGATAPAN
ncbi:MAG TPA: c-type cytochrome domain-containing protein, partial [Gemmataceae bacterium]|nr:c-type cytochrome domain-containing protein [Gemmataceae bacterium]